MTSSARRYPALTDDWSEQPAKYLVCSLINSSDKMSIQAAFSVIPSGLRGKTCDTTWNELPRYSAVH
jgi:hypothetical protein